MPCYLILIFRFWSNTNAQTLYGRYSSFKQWIMNISFLFSSLFHSWQWISINWIDNNSVQIYLWIFVIIHSMYCTCVQLILRQGLIFDFYKWCFVSSGLETPLQGCGWKNVSVIKRFWQNVEWTGGNLKVSELYTVITECQICMLKYYVFVTFC